MPAASAKRNRPAQPGLVQQWINQRTWGRVRDLSVEHTGDRVIVHGHAGSHYHKQLALAAAMETVQPDQLVLDIDVTPVAAHPAY